MLQYEKVNAKRRKKKKSFSENGKIKEMCTPTGKCLYIFVLLSFHSLSLRTYNQMTWLTKLFNFNEVSFDTASNNGGNEW